MCWLSHKAFENAGLCQPEAPAIHCPAPTNLKEESSLKAQNDFISITGCQAHRDIVASSCAGCENGYCFLGKCFCSPGYQGSSCADQYAELPNSCEKDECFFSQELGVPIVSKERWNKAQQEEEALWNSCTDCTNDRWLEHAKRFNFFQAVSQPVGKYIEIGCGPFTQSLSLFGTYRKDLVSDISSLTLLDPSVFDYVQNVEKNTYKDGKLLGMKVVLIGGPSEQFPVCEFYDTLLVINVAEHVQNIYKHFETIYFALKDNGQLIFHDRAWGNYDPVKHSQDDPRDVMFHPTRTKDPVFNHFLAFFEPQFCETHITYDPLNPKAYYFIGRKLPREKVWSEAYTDGSVSRYPDFKCNDVSVSDVEARQPPGAK